ncbi:Exosome component 5 [Sparganum proliferum]
MHKANLFLELNSVCDAAGSATWAFGDAHVVASVYGPLEASMSNELTHRAAIEFNIVPVSGIHSPAESEMETFLVQFAERLIETKDYPRCQLNVRIQMVSGTVGHPATMAACINALTLALLQTSIPLRATVVAVCTSELDPTLRPITLAVDVTHPLLSLPTPVVAKKAKSDSESASPLVFGVYFGRPEATTSLRPISPSTLLALTSSPTSTDPITVALYARVNNLFSAMLEQIAAVASQA